MRVHDALYESLSSIKSGAFESNDYKENTFLFIRLCRALDDMLHDVNSHGAQCSRIIRYHVRKYTDLINLAYFFDLESFPHSHF